jgi:hypothetical protein
MNGNIIPQNKEEKMSGCCQDYTCEKCQTLLNLLKEKNKEKRIRKKGKRNDIL